MKSITVAAWVASSALLVACGGGGSSGSPEATSATSTPVASVPSVPSVPSVSSVPGTAASGSYDAQRAWVNLLSTTRTWTVSGTASDAKRYELTLSTEPGGAAVFPVTGVAASKANLHNRLKEGDTVLQDVLNEQFFDAEYRLLGARVSTDGGTANCSQTEVIAALPLNSAPAGASGPMYAATTLSDCSASATQLGTSYHTWSLTTEAGVVYFCVASSNRFLGEATDRLSETCVETDANGTLGAKARIKLVLPGFSVTATN